MTSPRFTSVINTVLASLEASLCFRSLELQVSALLDRTPVTREVINWKAASCSEFVYVNDAYPRCHFKCKKFKGSKRKITITPFLKMERRSGPTPQLARLRNHALTITDSLEGDGLLSNFVREVRGGNLPYVRGLHTDLEEVDVNWRLPLRQTPMLIPSDSEEEDEYQRPSLHQAPALISHDSEEDEIWRDLFA